MIVALEGTALVLYPANNADLLIPVANGVVNTSEFEYRLNGPVFTLADIN
jgi:hypothetical protein